MLSNKLFFVGVGFAKSGTSWLAKYARAHPDICFSPIKELHYFDARFQDQDKKINREFARQIAELAGKIETGYETLEIEKIALLSKRLEMNIRPQAYVEYFENLVDDTHIAFGEITPAYSMIGNDGFAAIKGLIPNVRFIVILRNPVDRYWSQLRFSQHFWKNFSAVEEFEDRLSDERFCKRGDYKSTLTALESVVPRNKIFITFYENLFGERGQDEVQRLTSFLNIRNIQADFNNIVNQSKQEELPDPLRKIGIDALRDNYEAVAERFPEDLPRTWRDDMTLL